jgi:hypothetical protein
VRVAGRVNATISGRTNATSRRRASHIEIVKPRRLHPSVLHGRTLLM